MSATIACDICQFLYQVDEMKLGSELKCKKCRARFEAVEYIPPPENEDEAGVTWQGLFETGRTVVSALIIMMLLPAMGALFWINPIVPQTVASPAKTKQKANSTRSSSSRYNKPRLGTQRATAPQSAVSQFPAQQLSKPRFYLPKVHPVQPSSTKSALQLHQETINRIQQNKPIGFPPTNPPHSMFKPPVHQPFKGIPPMGIPPHIKNRFPGKLNPTPPRPNF